MSKQLKQKAARQPQNSCFYVYVEFDVRTAARNQPMNTVYHQSWNHGTDHFNMKYYPPTVKHTHTHAQTQLYGLRGLTHFLPPAPFPFQSKKHTK